GRIGRRGPVRRGRGARGRRLRDDDRRTDAGDRAGRRGDGGGGDRELLDLTPDRHDGRATARASPVRFSRAIRTRSMTKPTPSASPTPTTTPSSGRSWKAKPPSMPMPTLYRAQAVAAIRAKTMNFPRG